MRKFVLWDRVTGRGDGETLNSQRHLSDRAEEATCGWMEKNQMMYIFKEINSFDISKHYQMCLENTGLANWINRRSQHAKP